jgi:hypothetical protein
MFKCRSSSLLDCGLNNGQIIFNSASTAGIDNTRNMALIAYNVAIKLLLKNIL